MQPSRSLTAAATASQLGPRADAELRVDAREVRLDGADADEQCVGDLLVGTALCDKAGDPLLGGRQPAGGGAPADPGELGPRPLGPEPCADRLEDRPRLFERAPRVRLPLEPPLNRAQHDQRARTLERDGQVPVELERGLRVGERGVQIRSGRGEQCPAARRRRTHSEPVKALAGLLPRNEYLLRIFQPTDAGQRLDGVRHGHDVRQPGIDRRGAQKSLRDRPQPLHRRGVVPERQLQEPERGAVDRRKGHIALRLGLSEPPLPQLARPMHVAHMRGHECAHVDKRALGQLTI